MARMLGVLGIILVGGLFSLAADNDASRRGKLALEGKPFIPSFWPRAAYDQVWKQWDRNEKPSAYSQAFRDRYGLHEAPYPNDGLPMGLRQTSYLPFVKGLAIDCMVCHGGSVLGNSIVGLGNSSLDIHALFEELYAASNLPAKLPFTFSQVRGTNEAGAFSVYLLGYRNDDLSLRLEFRDLGLHDDSCEDVPAWWLLKKKTTMYHVGATSTDSARSIMQFMMHPLVTPNDFTKAEPAFRDILAYLKSLDAPKYPGKIDATLAAQGQTLFTETCARCHGTYGPKPSYPNKVIPLDELGTDRKRFDNIGLKFGEAYAASWFGQERPARPIRPTVGYQAPPLDGVWATAPYFHNGSVPTLAGVLNSSARPKLYTRSYRTGSEDFDSHAVGWKVRAVTPPVKDASPFERRKIYDTTQPGRGNGGHTYGDHFSDTERHAIIEYLKSL